MVLFKPLHNLLLAISTLFFGAAFLTLKKTLQILALDSVIIVPFSQIFLIGAVYLSTLWLLYTFTGRLLFARKLYNIHIITTVILIILIVCAALWSNQFIVMYTSNSLEQASLASEVGQLIVGTVITLTIIQLLYPLNLIIGLFKNKKS